MNAYELSELLGVATPDSIDSPGGVWLQSIYDAFQDTKTEILAAEEPEDAALEVFDCASLSIYTAWRVFVDLCMWNYPSELWGGCSLKGLAEVPYAFCNEIAAVLCLRLLAEAQGSENS